MTRDKTITNARLITIHIAIAMPRIEAGLQVSGKNSSTNIGIDSDTINITENALPVYTPT